MTRWQLEILPSRLLMGLDKIAKIQWRVFECFLGIFLALPLQAAIPHPIRTDRGWVRGTVRNKVMSFKGIPYAAPPVGALRWRPPQLVVPWTGVRPAQRFSASCMQSGQPQLPWTAEYNIGPPYSEDCLYLNVWTAARSSKERCPVLFWIHGGGFKGGSGSVPIYDGTNLARKGLVVVTVNYRLGVFGFFADSALAAESSHHASGDYGMLDLLAALQWVQRNISDFGGDPDNVTIAGQSAGSAAVHLLIDSPLARGLFERAIAESGSRVGGHSQPLTLVEQADEAWAAANGAHSVAELRKIPATELEAMRAASRKQFGPVADGWFLPAAPGTTADRVRESDVPIMTGMTADDIGTTWQRNPVTAASFRQDAESRFGPLASTFLTLYPANSDVQTQASAKQAGRDRMLTSMYLWAAERTKTAKTPGYTYYFSRITPGPVGAVFGAFHASDIPYFFDNLQESPRPWTMLDRHLASVMSSYWVHFARNGDPNGVGLPQWPAFNAADPRTMQLGAHIGLRPFAMPDRLSFFTRYFDSQHTQRAQHNLGGAPSAHHP